MIFFIELYWNDIFEVGELVNQVNEGLDVNFVWQVFEVVVDVNNFRCKGTWT